MIKTSFVNSLLFILCAIGLAGCGGSESDELNSQNVYDAGDYDSADDVDSMIEEIWIELNEEKPVPLDEWFRASGSRNVEWLTKSVAVDLQAQVASEFGLTLCALESVELPNHTTAIVAKIDDSIPKVALKEVLLSAMSPYQLSVWFGNRWVMYDAVLDDRGEYLPR